MKHKANNRTFFQKMVGFFNVSRFTFHVSRGKGLTLIELLVTMTMIGIISAVVFGGHSSIEKKLALQRAAYKLSQDLREAQEMAMGSRFGDCGAKEVCGYGIYFESTHYSFFIDCSDDCPDSNHRKDGQDRVPPYPGLRQVNLEGNIQITDTAPNSLSVLFSPPDPIVYINGVDWGTEATVTLGLDSETRQVKINSAGRVEIE